MSTLDLLVDLGPPLALGLTLLLGLAAAAMALTRDPLHAQRLGEGAVAAALLFCALALVPAPRPLAHWTEGLQPSSAPTSERAAPIARGPWPIAGGGPEAIAAPEVVVGHSQNNVPAADTLSAETFAQDAPEPATSGDRARMGQPLTLALPSARWEQAPASTAGPLPLIAHPTQPADTLSRRTLARGAAALILLGSLALLLRLLAGVRALRTLLAQTQPAPDWVGELIADQDQLGDPDRVCLRVTERRMSPFCTLWRRPTVVLPATLVQPGQREGLRAVLLHELAHLRAGDGRGRLLLSLAQPVLWWHPLFWWLRRRVRLCAELRADGYAARLAGKGRYARRLLDLASAGLAVEQPPLAAPSIFGTPHDLTRRIEMLMHRKQPLVERNTPLHRALQGAFAIGLLTLSASLFGATPVSAQSAGAETDALRLQLAQMRVEREVLQATVDNMSKQVTELRAAAQRQQANAWNDAAKQHQLAELSALGYLQSSEGEHQDALAEFAKVKSKPKEKEREMVEREAEKADALARLTQMLSAQSAAHERAAVLSLLEATAPNTAAQLTDQKRAAELAKLAADSQLARLKDFGLPTANVAAAASNDLSALALAERVLENRSLLAQSKRELSSMAPLVAGQFVPEEELGAAETRLETALVQSKLLNVLLDAELAALDLELAALSKDGEDVQSQVRALRLSAQRQVLASVRSATQSSGVR